MEHKRDSFGAKKNGTTDITNLSIRVNGLARCVYRGSDVDNLNYFFDSQLCRVSRVRLAIDDIGYCCGFGQVWFEDELSLNKALKLNVETSYICKHYPKLRLDAPMQILAARRLLDVKNLLTGNASLSSLLEDAQAQLVKLTNQVTKEDFLAFASSSDADAQIQLLASQQTQLQSHLDTVVASCKTLQCTLWDLRRKRCNNEPPWCPPFTYDPHELIPFSDDADEVSTTVSTPRSLQASTLNSKPGIEVDTNNHSEAELHSSLNPHSETGRKLHSDSASLQDSSAEVVQDGCEPPLAPPALLPRCDSPAPPIGSSAEVVNNGHELPPAPPADVLLPPSHSADSKGEVTEKSTEEQEMDQQKWLEVSRKKPVFTSLSSKKVATPSPVPPVPIKTNMHIKAPMPVKVPASSGAGSSQMIHYGAIQRLKASFGFIRSNRSVDYYFRASDFEGSDSLLKVGLAVEFNISRYSDTRAAQVKATSAVRSICRNPQCQKRRHFSDACPFGPCSATSPQVPVPVAGKSKPSSADAKPQQLSSVFASRSRLGVASWHDVRVEGHCPVCCGSCQVPT